ILNIDEAAIAVTQLINELERQLEEDIAGVSIAYAGQPMKVYKFSAERMTSGEGMVTREDVDLLYREAENVQVETGFTILHIIPQSYLIDGEISDLMPAGITGRKIEATYKIISVPNDYLVNLRR